MPEPMLSLSLGYLGTCLGGMGGTLRFGYTLHSLMGGLLADSIDSMEFCDFNDITSMGPPTEPDPAEPLPPETLGGGCNGMNMAFTLGSGGGGAAAGCWNMSNICCLRVGNSPAATAGTACRSACWPLVLG